MDDIADSQDSEQEKDITNFINKFDQRQLLNAVAALQLSPKNHGKEIRFEIFIHEILKKGIPSDYPLFLNSRVFWGHDLDFREEIYKDIANGNSKLIDPLFLGVANVYYDGQRPVEVLLADVWQEI